MTKVRVTITRQVSDDQPGFVEAQLVDARGRVWSFIDKEPVLSADYLDATSLFPMPGFIACEVVRRMRDATGRELFQIDTERPWHVESVEGETRFEVFQESLAECADPRQAHDRGNSWEPSIRAAEEKDAPAIAKLYVEAFEGLMPRRQLDAELVARWRQDIAAPPPQRWWVAERDGVVTGFAGIGPSRDPVDPELGELDTIAVDPRFWRHGIGRALMSRALQYLVADGYREAVLWTLAGYERGRNFYEAMGWSLDGGTRDEGRQVRYRHSLLP